MARGVDAVTDDPEDLTSGFWAVVVTFEGELTAVRMRDVSRHGRPAAPDPAGWPGLTGPWRSSLDEGGYVGGVDEIRRRIAAGTVYQVNLCRVLEHDLPEGSSVLALGEVLARGNPAPYAATIDIPEAGLEVACASPEAYLVRRGERLTSGPIKGTAADPHGLRHQGLRRERHDRRPRPQRPGPRQRGGDGGGGRPVSPRAPSRSGPSGLGGDRRPCAPGRAGATSSRRPSRPGR